MANFKHRPNLTVLTIAEPVKDLLWEIILDFQPVVDQLNRDYDDERARMKSNLDDNYSHGGLAIRLRIRKQKFGDFPSAELVWVRGQWKVNSEAARDKDNRRVAFTKALHHCCVNGGYTDNNIKMMLRGRARWEIELTKEFERRVRPLREYIVHMHTVYKALCHHAPPPIIELDGW